jgi:circadian clock protein KaiC
MRVPTGVPGLDEVLGGGFEPGSVVVLGGAPGTGKTILAQQICFANATTERRAVYYTTLSETHSKLVRHLNPFSFFDADALGSKVEYVHLGDLIRETRGEDPQALVSEVVRETLESDPAVVVIDSAKALRDFFSQRELRTAFYDLASRVGHTQAVLLLLGEYTPGEMQSGVEFSLADGILELRYEAHEPMDRRWLRVVKLRGGSHLAGKHTFRFDPSGIEVFPRTETLPLDRSPAETSGRISSGTPHLDALMGGGIGRADATVVLGPSGAGKTIFGLRFVAQGLEDGERCLYVTFQDTSDQLVQMATGFGWDLEAQRASRQLMIQHVPMGELDLDALAGGIRAALRSGAVRRIVIDSLAELVFAAREGERFPAYARGLAGLIRDAGASLVITSETTTLGPTPEPVEGLTFLFHNVILLRYIEENSEMGRALNIVKMRNSDHDKGVFRFAIDAHGLTIGDRLEGITGVLGWSALRGNGASQGSKHLRPDVITQTRAR